MAWEERECQVKECQRGRIGPQESKGALHHNRALLVRVKIGKRRRKDINTLKRGRKVRKKVQYERVRKVASSSPKKGNI